MSGVHSFMPRHDGGYPFRSRGWEPVACLRTSCALNDQTGHCAAQKQFPLDEESKCTGFKAQATGPKGDSE